MPLTHPDWVHFGCGLCAPVEWSNYDCSPSLRLQRLPIVGRFLRGGPHGRFPDNVRYGDIVRGFPIPNGTASLVYSSHVLEHLSLADLRKALRNVRRVMTNGGVFRSVLPDLEQLIAAYQNDNASEAAVRFMENTLLGEPSRDRSVRGLVRQLAGNSRHLWMWDYKSLAAELQTAGFTAIRRATFHDSLHEGFRLVEQGERWRNQLGIECEAGPAATP
jgi:SAM-dependent methyltransferase